MALFQEIGWLCHRRIFTALCELVDELIKDIQHLELECIGSRYMLSRHMEEEQGSLLRCDILEDLGRRHYGRSSISAVQSTSV